MFVKKNSTKNGRILLTFTEAYRENGKSKQRNVETIGYLDELEEQYDDPLAHFRAIARQRTAQVAESKQPIRIEVDPATKIEEHELGIKNLGYAEFEKIYHELGLHTFFRRRENRLKIDYNLNAIFRLLVYSRLMDPGSKKQAYEHQGQFFETYAPNLESVYRSLDYFDHFNLDMQTWISKELLKQYGRRQDIAYYDVTNYYFEIDEEDELRRRGPSKEHRPFPLVQMGLLLDSNGLPLAYHLFPGNGSEKLSLNPLASRMQEDYDVGRIVFVADKGLNCGDNIAVQLAQGNGYIYSQTIRGADQEFKQFVLSEAGYRPMGEDGKVKSRLYPREITFTNQDGRKEKIRVDQKQVVYYSQNYADKARYERNRTLAKTRRLFNSPRRLLTALHYSAAGYIKGLQYNKEGEIIDTKTLLYLDEEKIAKEAKYDGYYAIVTSELDMADGDVIDIYHGLWKIEETFKISKSELRTRPVYVSLEAHIEAHFLTCFVALVLLRTLELKMNRTQLPEEDGSKRFCAFTLLDSLRQFSCSYMAKNLYSFHYIDDNLKAIASVLGFDLDRKYMTRGEIKKIIAKAKK
ncbi:MAG TPA: IS1634 family transposase [Clostridia bacterium]|nr:IS1634 family transposase [Clostridia bacterium]